MVSASKLCNTTGDVSTVPLSSQNFESGFDAYDSMGAQSCTLKSRRAKITGIVVVGTYYAGLGPADSENVVFFADATGVPGAVINSQTVSGTAISSGSFDIPLKALIITKAANPTFWVSVQVNMDFESNGQWGWYTTDLAHGLADQWQNPGDGFGYCPSWCAIDTIYSDSVSFQSALKAGRARGD